MRKTTSQFVCQECGYESSQWLGKCPECGNWNSLKELKIQSVKGKVKNGEILQDNQPISFTKVGSSDNRQVRINTGFVEMDTVLGGGIVKGSVILIAGDPGIGKSTLLLQVALKHSELKGKVLYVSGEESSEQIRLRGDRILAGNKSIRSNNFKLLDEHFFLLSNNNTDVISEIIAKEKPSLVVIDSIQTMESENVGGLSGSVAQIRYASSVFIRLAKTLGIPIIIVGHVTKEGMVAGPMLLSHMVDTVLFLEGQKETNTRILRSFKNRFGPVDEVGVFVLEERGMVEALDPEHIFLSKKLTNVPGTVLTVTQEGSRVFLVEIQALVVYSKLPMPRRVANGIDQKRLELLLAVLQKHVRLPVENMDVFVNVAGGIKLSDRAVDLAICLAIFSSLKNISLSDTVGISEVGLLGELRNVSAIDKRVKEAKKLGVKRIITSKTHSFLSDVIGVLAKENK